MAKSASATALPSIAAWTASDEVPKTRVRLSSKSSMPAAAIHMRQFGQVTPWRDHSMCTSRVVEEIARRLQRRTVAQECRAADRDEDVVEQPVGGKARIFAGAEADADIDVVDVEVADIVGDVEAQLDVGPDCAKAVDAPHQPFGGEMRVGRHLEQRLAARQLLRPRHRAVEQVDGVGRGLEQHGARLGQPHGAAGAGKQRHAELVLDFLDLMADRRRRQAEFVGGAGEIQVPGRRLQRPQGTGTGHETSH